MLRKEFIKSAALLVGGSAINPINKFSEIQEPTKGISSIKFKKGLGFGMIKEEISLIDKFKLVKDLGFNGIEFNSPVEFSLKDLLDAKNKTGIEIPSLVNSDHWKKPLSDPDPSVRKFIIDSVGKSLQEIKELGGDTVLVVPGIVSENVSYEAAYNNALDSVRKLIPYVEKTGMKIGLENVWNNFLLSPLEAKQFVDTIDHPLIGWYFDIGNVLRYGWPEHWIKTLGKRIVKLHVKEFSRDIMSKEGLWKGFNVELTKGDINWPEVVKSLNDINYKGEWMTLELAAGDRTYLAKLSEKFDEIIK